MVSIRELCDVFTLSLLCRDSMCVARLHQTDRSIDEHVWYQLVVGVQYARYESMTVLASITSCFGSPATQTTRALD